jgi:hypothetical protein
MSTSTIGRPKCAWCHKRHRAGVECPVKSRESADPGTGPKPEPVLAPAWPDADLFSDLDVEGALRADAERQRAAEERQREFLKNPKGTQQESRNPTRDRLKEMQKLRWQRFHCRKAKVADQLTIEEWLEILDRYDWKCAYCRGPYQVLEHPAGREAGHHKGNVKPACFSCNCLKRRDPDWYPGKVPPKAEREVERVKKLWARSRVGKPSVEALAAFGLWLDRRKYRPASSYQLMGRAAQALGIRVTGEAQRVRQGLREKT